MQVQIKILIVIHIGSFLSAATEANAKASGPKVFKGMKQEVLKHISAAFWNNVGIWMQVCN